MVTLTVWTPRSRKIRSSSRIWRLPNPFLLKSGSTQFNPIATILRTSMGNHEAMPTGDPSRQETKPDVATSGRSNSSRS